MAQTRECEQIREDLVGLIEGDLDPALREHLADCDACRDLRHEVQRAMAEVAAAGDDYVPPPDLEARVRAVLDARSADEHDDAAAGIPVTRPPETSAPTASAVAAPPVAAYTPAPSVSSPTAGTPVTPAAAAFAPTVAMTMVSPPPRAASAPVPTASTAGAPPEAPPVGAKTAARNPRRRTLFIAGGVALAAAVSVPLLFRNGATNPRDTNTANTTTTTTTPPPTARDPWRGRLAAVARAAADHTGGVEVRLAGAQTFAPLAEGAEIPAGASLRTDPRTRARIDLADGSNVVLDRATEVFLDATRPRSAALRSGSLVADVAHLDGVAPAQIDLPNGSVTVLGTKFALTTADQRSTVRVTRGAVRLADARGQGVDVKTGEEGVVSPAGELEVSPAVDLASSVAWSELSGAVRAEPDAPILGLGELRARRPGQTAENDHQVTLSSHSVRVRIVGNIARTEIEETFRNDTPHELEGIYRFPLPPEAQIEKLALDVQGRMEEGAFVDRQRAAAIWRGVIRNAVQPIQQQTQTDELVWVPGPWRDPALLEWQRGGRFELRVFPIPAHGSRRMAIAYTQVIPASGGVRRYVYPLAHDANGSTRVESFDVDVQVLGHDTAAGLRSSGYALATDVSVADSHAARLSFAQQNFVPAGDLVVEYALPNRNEQLTAWAFQPAAGASPIAVPSATAATASPIAPAVPAVPAATGGTTPTVEDPYVALVLRPSLPRWTDIRPRDYAIIVDVSRSMVGERLARATRLARSIVAEMDPRDRIALLACDTTCRQMPGGLQNASAATARTVETFLAAEEPAGASDLVAQVREAAALVRSTPDRDARIVYLGDGAATVGYRRPQLVAAEVADAMPAGRATLTTVALGVDADTTLLGAMARAGGGVVVPYVPGESVGTAALAVLESTYGITLRDPTLTLPPELVELAPSRLPTIRAGSEALVVARMHGTEVRGEAVLRGTVGGEPFEARYPLAIRATSNAGNAFVPRVFAATRIAELEATAGDVSREEIVRLSQRFHVASRYTSLLVLESDAMYRAFGVRRNEQGVATWTGDEEAEPTTAVAALGNNDRAQLARVATGGSERAADPGVFGGLTGTGEGGGGRGARIGSGTVASVDQPTGEDSSGDDHADTEGVRDNTAPEVAATAPAMTRSANAGASGSGNAQGYQRPEQAPPAVATATPAMPMAPPPRPPAGPMATGDSVAAGRRARAPMAEPMGGAPTGGMAVPIETLNRGGLQTVTRRPAWGQYMRRVWVRHGAVAAERATRAGDHARAETARFALQAVPDSRDRHRELYRWLSVAGEFDEAADVAARWTTRDALDPEAITRVADMAARRGDRDLAVRTLAGIVDVRPDDVAGHQRLATLHERAGDAAQACAYRVAIAEVRPNDADGFAAAVRCERALGHGAAAARLLQSVIDPTLRARIEAAATAPATAPSQNVRGDLTVEATWSTPVDLDVAVIDARGNRISWLGGRATGLSARGVRGLNGEALSVSRASVGDYTIEVSRTVAGDQRPVRGQLDISALGEHRTVQLVLMPGESTVRVARASVTRESRLVPVNRWE